MNPAYDSDRRGYCPQTECEANRDGECAVRTGARFVLPAAGLNATMATGSMTMAPGMPGTLAAGAALGLLSGVGGLWTGWQDCPRRREAQQRQ